MIQTRRGQELRGGCFPLLQIQLGRGQGRQTGVVGMRPRDAPWGGSECQQRSRMDPVCLCSGLLRSSWPRALVYNLVCSSCWGPEGQGLHLIQLWIVHVGVSLIVLFLAHRRCSIYVYWSLGRAGIKRGGVPLSAGQTLGGGGGVWFHDASTSQLSRTPLSGAPPTSSCSTSTWSSTVALRLSSSLPFPFQSKSLTHSSGLRDGCVPQSLTPADVDS